MKLPIVYYQIKKIRDIWLRLNHPQKEEMLKIFNEKLKEIEEEHLMELVNEL
jgi:hypothetical protein